MRVRLYLHLVWRLIAVVRNWPVYWLNHFGYTKGEVSYKLRNGLTITSRAFAIDGGALNDVWFDESYEPNHFGIPFDWSTCRTIVDIGANIGTFTTYAGFKSPNAAIVAVEPEPDNLNMLERNVRANNFGNRVTIVPAAIGGSDGTVTLHITEKSSGGHSLYHKYGKTRDVEVPLVGLLTLLVNHHIGVLDFLKLDCEGGEYDALYSLSPEVLSRIRFMAVEYHHFSPDPRHTPDQLRAFLTQNGFVIKPGKKSMFFAQNANPAA
ncbi:MAG TPA: FkbM family methyltransferase [Candidatus Peribacteria bacterium]|nr:FkbM family methyltransferase [Candidatus Peribacteria bacterium]